MSDIMLDILTQGYSIIDYDENFEDLLVKDFTQFKSLNFSTWTAKIKRLNKNDKILKILLKYELYFYDLLEQNLNIKLHNNYNNELNLSAIIYYDKNDGYNDEHYDYGLFNIILNGNCQNTFYVEKNGKWELVDCKNKLVFILGESIEEYSKGRLKGVKHKVIKPYGEERYVAINICYPIDKRKELLEKKHNWISLID